MKEKQEICNSPTGRKINWEGSVFVRKNKMDKNSPYLVAGNVLITNIPTNLIAYHLTLIDIKLFKNIPPDELLSCGWNSKKKLLLAPNVINMMRQFNNISYYTIDEILRLHTSKQRSQVLHHFIKLSKKLFQLNNINSMKAVISALQSSYIYRLKETWDCLSKKDRDLFQRYETLFSEINNREKLRSHLSITKLPCIPYLGMYLTDLTYIDTIYPSTGGMDINRNKKMSNVIKLISEFQQSEYDTLNCNEHLIEFFTKERYIDELKKFIDDRNYERSLELEPLKKDKNLINGKVSQKYKAHSRVTSMSDSVKSINLNSNERKPTCTSLLDDSPLTYSPNPNKILRYSRNCFDTANYKSFIRSLTVPIVYEGILKRSLVLEDGSKKKIFFTRRFWVTLLKDKSLTHHYATSLFSCVTNGSSDKHNDNNVINVSNFNVKSIIDDPKSFHLIDDENSVIYQYKSKSQELTEEWIKVLSLYCKPVDNGSVHLISFDSVLSLNNSDT